MTLLFTCVMLSMQPMAEPADPTQPTEQERLAKLAMEWKQVLPKEVVRPELHYWLSYLDPHPVKAFTPFTDERVHRRMLCDSSYWSEMFFQEAANPASKRSNGREPDHVSIGGHLGADPKKEEDVFKWVDSFRGTGVEGGYYLPTEPNRHTLLLFRWKAKGYKFEMQESTMAVLLRIKFDATLTEIKEGFSRTRIEAMLKDVLSKELLAQGALKEQFQIPEIVLPGTELSNAGKELGFACIGDWKESVLLFVTEEDIGVLLFKAIPNRQLLNLGHFNAKDVYRTSIFEKDGKTLVQPKK